MNAAKIERNPYIVGNPIRGKDMFFGREDDFRYLRSQFDDEESNRLVVFSGDRRSGKTSILFQVLEGRLGDHFLPVLFDMQMLASVGSDTEFFVSLTTAACNAAGCTARIDNTASAYLIAHGMFEEIAKTHPDKVVLFLFDEYELIESKIEDGTLTILTIQTLAAMLESNWRVSFVFAGSTGIDERTDCWWPLLVKSTNRHITHLSPTDTERLVTEPLRGIVAYPDSVVSRIFRLTAGQPFFTQVVCQNIVDILIEEDRIDPTDKDIDRVVENIIKNPLPHMIYSWKSQSIDVKLILSAVATKGKSSRSWVTARGLAPFVMYHLPIQHLPTGRLHSMLEEAFHLGFFEKVEDRYQYKMELLRHWIAREHSIWNLSTELDMRDSRKSGYRRRFIFAWLRRYAAIPIIVAIFVAIGIIAASVLLPKTDQPSIIVLPVAGNSAGISADPLMDGFSRALAINMIRTQNYLVAPYDPSFGIGSPKSGRKRYVLSTTLDKDASQYNLRVGLENERNETVFTRVFRNNKDELIATAVEILRLVDAELDFEQKSERNLLIDAIQRMAPRSVEGYLRALHFLDIREPSLSHTALLRRLGITGETRPLMSVSDRHFIDFLLVSDPDTESSSFLSREISHPSNFSRSPVAFAPRNNAMPFVNVSPDRTYWLFAMDLSDNAANDDRQEQLFIANYEQWLFLIQYGYTVPVWAHKGLCVAAEKRGGGISIYGSDTTISLAPSISWRTIAEYGRSPNWSVYGAFAFDGPDDTATATYIWYMESMKDEPERLIFGNSPHFAPDGHRVAYFSDDSRSAIHIFDMRIRETTLLYKNDDREFRKLEWSPDGSRLVVEFADPGDFAPLVLYVPDSAIGIDIDVAVIDVSTGALINISDSPGPDLHPVWSPDGTRIAFQSYRDGNWEIYLSEADGSDSRNITNHPSADVHPAW